LSSKKLVHNSLIYTLFSFLQRGISLLLIPIYTRVLTTTDYGIISVIGSIIEFFTVFFSLSLTSSVIRFYFDKPNDKEYEKELFGTIFTFITILSGSLSLVLLISGTWIIKPFMKDVPYSPYFYIALITMSTGPLFNIFQGALKAKQIGLQFAIQNMSKFIINLSLILLLVVIMKLGALGVILSNAIASLLFFVYSLIFLINNYGFRVNTKLLKETLKYSGPLIPNRIAGWAIGLSNKLFVNGLRSVGEAGLFSIGYNFASLIHLFTTNVNHAVLPWSYEQLKSNGEDGEKKVVQLYKTILFLLSSFALVLCLFSKELIAFVVFGDFEKGWVVFPFYAFFYVFTFIKTLWLTPLTYSKIGTKYAPICTYTAAGLNIVFCFLLIPKYGIIGAGISALVSRFISTFVMMYFSRKIMNIGHNPYKLYGFSISSFLIAMVVFFPSINSILIKSIIAILTLFFTYVLSKNEIHLLLNVLFSRKK